jgi:hypothetical protein
MGAKLSNEDRALIEAKKIPYECREYLSHHVRNGLLGILSIIILEDGETSETYDRVYQQVNRIVEDLKKIGI